MMFRTLGPALLVAACAHAQQAKKEPAPAPPQANAARPAAVRLNAASMRNENVSVQQIDNDAIKEANIRLGDNTTLITEAPATASYFAAEHGRAPSPALVLRSASTGQTWHSELLAWHQNSVFNSRTFFQVGAVKPSRQNRYGARASGPVPKLGFLTGAFSQRKVRGMVNGNVLVPLAEERTPLATDPAVREIVGRFLGAYPNELPNRPDFDPRALNTNSPQHIDETDASLRLDRDWGKATRWILSYGNVRQRTDAFQLVAGQNPDSEIHTQNARATVRRALSASTELAAGFNFQRVRSVLVSEPNAVGPRVRLGFQIEELGPDSMFPINRAQNTFRGGASATHVTAGGRHALTWGGDLTRWQVNGAESNNVRGYFQFISNFGNSAITNLRLGRPSAYETTLGHIWRGFRNWTGAAFFGDQFRVHRNLQIYYGLRHEFHTTPNEVNRLSRVPYSCDCNNFSPRLSLALRLPREWTMRAAYTATFGQIQPVTYQQVRNNLPEVAYVQVQNPDLLNPLAGIGSDWTRQRTAPTLLSADLVAPYAHLYGLTLERALWGGSMLRAGYVGSRSIKLLSVFIMNRAVPVADLSQMTTATVDQRRPDARFADVRRVLNSGIAWFDAAQISYSLPARRGLSAEVTYTFSKAIDEGADYTGTAANNDLLKGRSQWQDGVLADRKGRSNFDAPHALLVRFSYDLPRPAAAGSWLGFLANGWQASGSSLLKSGTPLTLYVGSDSPGFGNVDGGPGDRPNIIDLSILGLTIGNPDTAPQILRRERFAYVRLGELRGSVGRGVFRKGGIANFNAAVSKQWPVHKGEWTVMLRGEAYNLTNTPQFDEPGRNLSAPSFGRITNTLNDGRVFQFVLRISI